MKGEKEACCWERPLKTSHYWDAIPRRRRAVMMRTEDADGRFWHLRPFCFAFQQYSVEVQPAETNCFCASEAADIEIKLLNYIWLNFSLANTPSIQLLPASFHFNASHLPSPPLSCGGVSSLISPPALNRPHPIRFTLLLLPLFLPQSRT